MCYISLTMSCPAVEKDRQRLAALRKSFEPSGKIEYTPADLDLIAAVIALVPFDVDFRGRNLVIRKALEEIARATRFIDFSVLEKRFTRGGVNTKFVGIPLSWISRTNPDYFAFLPQLGAVESARRLTFGVDVCTDIVMGDEVIFAEQSAQGKLERCGVPLSQNAGNLSLTGILLPRLNIEGVLGVKLP